MSLSPRTAPIKVVQSPNTRRQSHSTTSASTMETLPTTAISESALSSIHIASDSDDSCDDWNDPNDEPREVPLLHTSSESRSSNGRSNSESVRKPPQPQIRSSQTIDLGSQEPKMEKCGWLTKQGQLRKNWRRRWFVMNSGFLQYFRVPDDDKSLGCLFLDCDVRTNVNAHDARYFQLVFCTGRSLLLRADSIEAANEWITTLARASRAIKTLHSLTLNNNNNISPDEQMQATKSLWSRLVLGSTSLSGGGERGRTVRRGGKSDENNLSASYPPDDGDEAACASDGDSKLHLKHTQSSEVPKPTADIEHLKFVSLSMLVQRLTPPHDPPSSLLPEVLVSYPCFTSPPELFAALCERFRIEETHGMTEDENTQFIQTQFLIRVRVVNVLKKWAQMCPQDFSDAMCADVLAFLEEIQSIGNDGLDRACTPLAKIFKRKIMGLSCMDDLDTQDPVGLIHTCSHCRIEVSGEVEVCPQCCNPMQALEQNRSQILEFDDQTIASHLMHVEHRMFRLIKPAELLNQAWTTKQKETVSPNVVRIVQYFNKVSFWVMSAVLSEENIEQRALLISRFISIAEHSHKMHNFNATKEIITGLTTHSIRRLKKTWQRVPNSKISKLNKLGEVVSEDNNYAALKQSLLSAPLPHMPFLGATLNAMMSATEVLKRTKENNSTPSIPFHKCRPIAKIILEIMRVQQCLYVAKPLSTSLVQMLESLPTPHEQNFTEVSRPDLE